MSSITNCQLFRYCQQSHEYLNEKSDLIAVNVLVPSMKMTYQMIGKISAVVGGCFSARWKKIIQNKWEDPVSTIFILRIFKPIEKFSCNLGSRVPIRIPLLHYLDVCLISSAQQLYVYLKEVNYLLSLPQHLKNYIATPSFNRLINKPSILLGRVWLLMSGPILLLKHIILKTLNIFFQLIDRIIDFFILGHKFYFFKYLKDIVKESADKVHLKFVDIAHRAIDKRETRLRKNLIKNVANYTLWSSATTFTRLAAKSGLGAITYFSAKKFLKTSLQSRIYLIDAAVCLVIGNILWKNTISPFLQSYYNTYNTRFDPEASSLRAFCKKYYISQLYPVLKTLKIYLQI